MCGGDEVTSMGMGGGVCICGQACTRAWRRDWLMRGRPPRSTPRGGGAEPNGECSE